MRSYSRVALVLLRSGFGICLSALALCSALAPALVPGVLHAQGTKPGATPMIGGDAILDVSPANGSTTATGNSASQSYVFHVENTGTANTTATFSISSCAGAVSSCSLSPSSASVPHGGSVPVTVTFHTAATGTGAIMLTANWPSANNVDGSVTVTLPGAQPLVTTTQPTEWTQQNVSTGFPYFTIKNTGNTAATYNLTASCTNVVAGTCSVVSPTGSVAPNGTTTAEVTFTTNPASSGNATATLTATSPYTQTSSASGTIVPMSEYVTVAGQTVPTPPAPGGSATYGFNITATGNNTSTVTYGLTATCTGTLSCSTTPSPGSVGISPGNPSTASVVATASSGTAGGAGTVKVTALYTDLWGIPYTGQYTYSVTVPPAPDYTPGVVPSSESGPLVIGQMTVDTFTVRNQGNTEANYAITPYCSSPTIPTCALANSMQSHVDLLPQETALVPVRWEASGSAPTDTVSLTASYGSWTATGIKTLTYYPWVAPSVTAQGIPPGGFSEGGVGLIQSFTVTNNGSSSATYSYGVSCVDDVGEAAIPASCVLVTQAPDTIAAGASDTVRVRFNAGDAGTSSTMTLTATDGSNPTTGAARIVITQTPASITTATSSVAEFSGVTETHSFVVHNPNAVTETYSWGIACHGAVSCTTTSEQIGVPANGSDSLYVSYTTSGAPNAMGAVVATANNFAGSATDSILVRIKSYMVQIAPVGSPDTVASGVLDTATFTVKNVGLDSTAYVVTASCDGTAATACQQPTTPVSLLPSQQKTVTVRFTGGTNFTSGSVMLHVLPDGGGVSRDSVFAVVVRSPGSLTVSTDFMNNDNQDMGACAASCFAAQYTLSTAPFYTLNTPRTTSLVYNSDRVSPRPFIYADVSPNTSAGTVQQYLLQVRKNGVNLPFTNGDDTLFFSGSSVPIRLTGQVDMSSYDTDLYPVDVMVTAVYSGGGPETVTSHTHLLVVNESHSFVAKGWTIAGPQHIYDRDSVAIVTDGTGSAEVFTKCGTYCYQAPTGDFSTLVVIDSSAGAARTWIRNYPDGSQLYFGGTGDDWMTYDGVGRSAYIGHDTQNRVTELDDPGLTKSWGSYATSVQYGANGIAFIQEPSDQPWQGRHLSFRVGADSLLYVVYAAMSTADSDSTVFTYDGQHRLSTVRNMNGAVTTYAYDPVTGKVAQVTGAAVPTDAGGGSTTLQQPTVVFTPWQSVGVPTVHTSSTAPATPVQASAVVARVKDPAGAVTQFTVDRWGQPLVTTDAMGNVTTITRTDMFATEVDESQGRKSCYTYEGPNLTISQPAGDSATHYHYGIRNQADSIWGAGVVPEQRGLNSNGTVAWVRHGSDTTHYAYDPATVQVDTITNPLGHKTVLQYDPVFGNVAHATAPSGQVASTTFDLYGRDSTSSSTGHATSTTIYDIMNRPVSVYDGVYATPTTFSYDRLGRWSVVTDPMGQTFRTEYDTAGRITRRYDATGSGKYNSYRYDIAGRTTSSTNRRGQRIDVTYDSLGRMLTRTDVATGTVGNFSYSADGLDDWATNANANENTELDVVHGQSMTWTTEGGVEYINGQTINPSFNVSDTSTVTAPTFGGTPSRRITGRDLRLGTLSAVSLGGHANTFGYDYQLGVRVSTTYVPPTQTTGGSVRLDGYAPLTGLLTETSFNMAGIDSVLHRAYGYDSAGRLTSEQLAINYFQDTDGAKQRQRQFSYDSLGRLTSVTVRRGTCMPWPSDSIAPDSLSSSFGWRYTCGAIAADSGATFSYDSAGNRTDHGAILTAGDRLVRFNGDTITYDDDGNMTSRSNPVTGESRQYGWNALGQLDSTIVVGAPDPITGVQTTMVERYFYDIYGRLVHSQHGYIVNGALVYADSSQNWSVYQGDQVSEQVQSSIFYTDVAYDDGTDRPAMEYTHVVGGDHWRSEVMDALGNVGGAVLDDSIGVAYTWDAWGENMSTTWDNAEVSGWKGLQAPSGYRPASGLIYMRARWYDPALGRFISEDPAGLAGGINPYVFADDDPINQSDPSGMFVSDDPVCVHFSNGKWMCSYSPVNITASGPGPFSNRNNWIDSREPVDPPSNMNGALYFLGAQQSNNIPFRGPPDSWQNYGTKSFYRYDSNSDMKTRVDYHDPHYPTQPTPHANDVDGGRFGRDRRVNPDEILEIQGTLLSRLLQGLQNVLNGMADLTPMFMVKPPACLGSCMYKPPIS